MILIVGGVHPGRAARLPGPEADEAAQGLERRSAASAPTHVVDHDDRRRRRRPRRRRPTTGTTVAGGRDHRERPAAQVAGVVIRPAGAPARRAPASSSRSRASRRRIRSSRGVKDGSGSGAAGGPARRRPGSGTTTAGSAAGAGRDADDGDAGCARLRDADGQRQAAAAAAEAGLPQGRSRRSCWSASDKNSIKIGVAGGKFTGGGAVKLELRQGRHADEHDDRAALRDEARLHRRPAGADRRLQAARGRRPDHDAARPRRPRRRRPRRRP